MISVERGTHAVTQVDCHLKHGGYRGGWGGVIIIRWAIIIFVALFSETHRAGVCLRSVLCCNGVVSSLGQFLEF